MEKVKGAVDGSPLMTSDHVPAPPPTPARVAPAPIIGAGWTPPPVPAPAASAPAPRPDPVILLDALVEQIDGVRGAILASVDGFAISRSTSMADEPSHPAMLAAAVGLAHQLVEMGKGTQLRQLVVDHDGGLMLVWPIGTERVLAVLTSTTVDQRRLRAVVQSRAQWLSGGAP
jgi:predicted regulator of Ras-like GTPase activity (Roadblock/LC7/MglB family)